MRRRRTFRRWTGADIVTAIGAMAADGAMADTAVDGGRVSRFTSGRAGAGAAVGIGTGVGAAGGTGITVTAAGRRNLYTRKSLLPRIRCRLFSLIGVASLSEASVAAAEAPIAAQADRASSRPRGARQSRRRPRYSARPPPVIQIRACLPQPRRRLRRRCRRRS